MLGYADHKRANVDYLRNHYHYDSIEYLGRDEMAALVDSGGLNKRLWDRMMPINNFISATEPLSEKRVAEINPRNIAFADSRFVVKYYRLSLRKSCCLAAVKILYFHTHA